MKLMQQRSSMTLSWSALLALLRSSSGESVHIRDGKLVAPAGSVRNRPSAKGTELCLFSGDVPSPRVDLVALLESLSKSAGRRFATSAKVHVGDSQLLIDGVGDEEIDGKTATVIGTRRPKLGYNQSQQTGDTTTFRSKRIKQW